MRFGFPGLGSAASTVLGAAAAKSAVSVHTGPAPSFEPKANSTTTTPAPLADPAAVPDAEPVPFACDSAIEELAPISGGVPASSAIPAALEEVSAPEPANVAPAIVPSNDMQEVEVLC